MLEVKQRMKHPVFQKKVGFSRGLALQRWVRHNPKLFRLHLEPMQHLRTFPSLIQFYVAHGDPAVHRFIKTLLMSLRAKGRESNQASSFLNRN